MAGKIEARLAELGIVLPPAPAPAANYVPFTVSRGTVYVAGQVPFVDGKIGHRGRVGETYNIGGNCEMKNIDVVRLLCALLDEARPRPAARHADLIAFVADRPGHDRRYAMDNSKIRRELGWQPAESLESGLRKAVRWYLEHQDWVAEVTSGAYRNWIAANYGTRGAA